MDVHQKSVCSDLSGKSSKAKNQKQDSQSQPSLYLKNAVFFGLFFSVVYFLLQQWREKIRTSTPLHVLTISEMAAVVSLIASFIYLMVFFGIGFILHPFSVLEEEDDEAVIEKYSDSCLAGVSPKLPPLAPKILVEKVAPAPVLLSMEDEEVVRAVVSGSIPSYSLESKLGDCKRAAAIRNKAVERVTGRSLEGLPMEGFDYDSILGQCCEMPIGFVQIPVGVAGPLLLDEMEYTVPMATTEGCLVASTNRGCKAIYVSGGASAIVLRDGMTRAPVVRFNSAKRASQLKFFLEDPQNFDSLSHTFNKSSRFARLQSIKANMAGKNLYIRFTCSTGDAMGMNMVSKGVQNVLDFLQIDYPDMDVIGISGKYDIT
ncbi:3-hydroxy-3-methylglutaryl coenzyme a reductase [Trifolium pratense]|uniref:hydroxymethylglutaryl-CoA reductase (NADPH) n=1 Tax=Trifolium pratense TaxID=57577 RepID=A0A2K3L2G2_TRIPR|nr:3-hydroxy-3-methylglutaryl coenzyme a reductase [Trifolium pratense]